MSNYNSLKATIDANIKQNGNQEITGQILNSVLNQMVTTLGTGYQFAGVATIATNPGTPDAKVFYIANGKGTYEKFGGLEVTEDDVVVFYYDTAWHKVSTGIASNQKLTELEGKVGQNPINDIVTWTGINAALNNASGHPFAYSGEFRLSVSYNESYKIDTIYAIDASDVRNAIAKNIYNGQSRDVNIPFGTTAIGFFCNAGVINGTFTFTKNASGLVREIEELKTNLESKVDKVEGKALSTNDFTDSYKGAIDGTIDEIDVIVPVIEAYNIADGATEGYYMTENGVPRASSSYSYTKRIPVTEGDVVTATSLVSGEKISRLLRFVTAFNNGVVQTSKGSASGLFQYVVPMEVDEVIVTYYRTGDEIPDTLNVVSNEISKVYKLKSQGQIDINAHQISSARGNEGCSIEKATLNNEVLEITDAPLYFRKSYIVSFKAKVTTFNKIEFGYDHGSGEGSLYLSIENNLIKLYKDGLLKTYTPSLEISEFIEATLSIYNKKVYITISTLGASVVEIYEDDGTGYVFETYGYPHVSVDTLTVLYDAKLSFANRDFSHPVWVFGDSFCSLYPARWTYQMMFTFGITNWGLSCRAGGKSVIMLDELKKALNFGTPKFLVWGLGMNDLDTTTSANVQWKDSFDEVMSICKERGITLIAATIPNVPDRINSFKNQVVKTSGLRYIDFAQSVDAEEIGATWYTGCLSNDNVHPTIAGAKALASQVLVDFPEIMQY